MKVHSFLFLEKEIKLKLPTFCVKEFLDINNIIEDLKSHERSCITATVA